MDRDSFLSFLIKKYAKFFTSDEQINIFMQEYESILPETTDFNALHRKMILGYRDTFKPPAPAQLNDFRLELKSEQEQELKKFVPFADGVAPPAEWLELKEKLGIK